nr:RDD family protein [Arsukibacterium sp.]
MAKRSHRFWGAIIDGVLQILVSIPLFWYVGLAAFAEPSMGLIIGSAIYGVVAYLLMHGYLLHQYGQTIGKAEFGMRIEHLNGQQASLKHIMLMRYLPMVAINWIPGIGAFIAGLLNPLMIFGKQKRCLHDHVAQTRVCYVSARQQPDDGMTA